MASPFIHEKAFVDLGVIHIMKSIDDVSEPALNGNGN